MAQQLQLRKGTTAQHAGFVGAIGEVTVDTTRKSLRVHDGVTAGGWEVGAKLPDGVKTVYIAARTDGREGTGTMFDPYDAGGATPSIAADKYDAIYSNRTKCPHGCLIRLMAGQYYTKGNTYYPEGYGGPNGHIIYPKNCSIIGDGIANTTLTYVGDPATDRTSMIRIYCQEWGQQNSNGAGKFSVVSDFTIDGNWQNTRKAGKAISGIFIMAAETGIVERVWAKNFGGDYNTSVESFVLNCDAWKLGVVRNCICTNPVNSISETGTGGQPYITWISGTGKVVRVDVSPTEYYYKSVGCGLMYGNVVVGGTPQYPQSTFAFGLFGQTVDCHSNYALNCTYAAHCDTGWHDAVYFHHNRVENCLISVSFNMEGNYNRWNFIHIFDNHCLLPDLPSPSTYYGFIRAINTKKVIKVSGNLVGMMNEAAGAKYTPWRVETAETLFMENNVVHSLSNASGALNIQNIVAKDNYDQNGLERFDFQYGNKTLYVKGTHSDPLDNGEELKRAINLGFANCIIVLGAGQYKLPATLGYSYNHFSIIGQGKPEDTVIDTLSGIGVYYSLAGSLTLKNVTVTSSSNQSTPNDRMFITLQDANNVFDNVIFKTSSNTNSPRTIFNGWMYGTFRNCVFEGRLSLYNGGQGGFGALKGTVDNCVFKNAFPNAMVAGSIVKNSHIIQNTDGSYIIVRGDFLNNTIDGTGFANGVVLIPKTDAIIAGCNFKKVYLQAEEDNSFQISNCYFEASGLGGAAMRSNVAGTNRIIKVAKCATTFPQATSDITINTIVKEIGV